MSDSDQAPTPLEKLLRASPPFARALEGFGHQATARRILEQLDFLANGAAVDYVEVPLGWGEREAKIAAFTARRVLLVDSAPISSPQRGFGVGSARTIPRASLTSLELENLYGPSSGFRLTLSYPNGLTLSVGRAGLEEPLLAALLALYPTLLSDLER